MLTDIYDVHDDVWHDGGRHQGEATRHTWICRLAPGGTASLGPSTRLPEPGLLQGVTGLDSGKWSSQTSRCVARIALDREVFCQLGTLTRPSRLGDVCDLVPVTLKSVERGGRQIDVTVADRALKAGDIALRVPENLIVTLAQIFECGDASELLTPHKLSELAVLTLYLCYEKKKGKDSAIYPFIKELDRQAARGSQGAKSPLLWGVEDLELLVRLLVSSCVGTSSSMHLPIRPLTHALRAWIACSADWISCCGGN